MQALTPQDVQSVLSQFDSSIHIRFFEQTTATSQQAADQIGCALGQIVKSICFRVDGLPVVVLTSGDQRVDDRKLALRFAVGRKKVKAATAEECVAIWGYPPGSVPPVGYRSSGITTLIDDSLQRFEQLYAAGGAHNAIFPIQLRQLVLLTGGTIADVVRRESDPE